jgi:hypothetical protein
MRASNNEPGFLIYRAFFGKVGLNVGNSILDDAKTSTCLRRRPVRTLQAATMSRPRAIVSSFGFPRSLIRGPTQFAIPPLEAAPPAPAWLPKFAKTEWARVVPALVKARSPARHELSTVSRVESGVFNQSQSFATRPGLLSISVWPQNYRHSQFLTAWPPIVSIDTCWVRWRPISRGSTLGPQNSSPPGVSSEW